MSFNNFDLYITPLKFKNTDYYYNLVEEMYKVTKTEISINDSDINPFINKVLTEICVKLNNSLKLAEMGYIDNAYYSLRCAHELSTLLLNLCNDKNSVTFFKEIKEEDYKLRRNDLFKKACGQGYFKNLNDTLQEFEIKENIDKILNKINNIVHKGQKDFCIYSIWYDVNTLNNKSKDFEKIFSESIKVLFIMFFIINPLNLILTLDEDNYYRDPGMIIPPFSEKMLNFIGKYIINALKKVELYKEFENVFRSFDKRNPSVDDFLRYDFIDLNKINEIYSQKNLIPKDKLKILEICSCTNKIVQICCDQGWFCTNMKKKEHIPDYHNLIRHICQNSNFKPSSLENKSLFKLKNLLFTNNHNLNDYYNILIDDYYISVMKIKENNEFICQNLDNLMVIIHYEKLDDDELTQVLGIVSL